MRWSIEELVFSLKIQYSRGYFWSRLIRLPKTIYLKIKTLFRWIFTGFCSETLWDLDNFLMKVILQRLQQFKKMKRVGYPGSLENEEEWEKIIDKLILGFQIMIDERFVEEYYNSSITVLEALKKQQDSDEETMKLFVEYFRSLWD